MALSARNPERGTHEPVRPSRRLDVYLISDDDAFLIEAGPAFSDRFRTRPIDDVAALPDPSEDTHWIVVLDASSQSDARAAVAQLEQRIRGRPIIVVLPNADSTDWRSALARGTVIDALPREQLQQPRFAAALVTAEYRAQGAALPIPEGRGRASTRRPTLVAIVVGALAVAALAALWLYHRGGVAPSAAPHPAAAAQSSAGASDSALAATAKAPSVTELLSAARVAFANPKAVLPRLDGAPRGDSALELYGQVLAQDPNNDEALDGIQRIWAVGRARIQAEVGSGKLDEASQMLATFKSAAVDPREISDTEATIATARPRWLATRAQESIAAGDLAQAEQFLAQLVATGSEPAAAIDLRHAIDARKSDAQLAAMARDVKAALDAGALLDPANDNVSTRLQAMRQLNRSSTLTLNAQRDVQAALLANAQEATQKGQFELAQRLIAAAADLGPTAGTAEARKALQAEMDASAQRAAAAAAAALSARQAASSPAPPAPASPATDQFIAAKPARGLNVEYPRIAAEGNLSGYVIVEFTLQPNGQASGAHVIEANPPKTFDASALSAVLHGRFDTSHLVNAQPQRARIKVSYAPTAPGTVPGSPGNPAIAAASVKPATAAPPADELIAAKPARPLEVIYPDSALISKIQGYVIVEFTLQHDGRAAGVHVVESSPPGVFDANAQDAVSRGHFDTSSLANGQAQRARIRLNFKTS